MEIFELFNTQTECVEGHQLMNRTEADERNNALRANREPQRWIEIDDTEGGQDRENYTDTQDRKNYSA